jgi:hypothetical protein
MHARTGNFMPSSLGDAVSTTPFCFCIDFINIFPEINGSHVPTFMENVRDCFFKISRVPHVKDTSPISRDFLVPDQERQVIRFIRTSRSPRLVDTRVALETFIKNNAPIFIHVGQSAKQFPVDVEEWLESCHVERGATESLPTTSLPKDEFDTTNPWVLKAQSVPKVGFPQSTVARPKIYVTVRPASDCAYINYTDITYHLFYPPVSDSTTGFVAGWKSLTTRYNNETLHLESVLFGSNFDDTLVPVPRDTSGAQMKQPKVLPNIDGKVTASPDVPNVLKVLSVKSTSSFDAAAPAKGMIKLHILVTPSGMLSASFPAPRMIPAPPSMLHGAPAPQPRPSPPPIISYLDENKQILNTMRWGNRVDAGGFSAYNVLQGRTRVPVLPVDDPKDPNTSVKPAIFDVIEAEMLGDDERGAMPKRRNWMDFKGLWMPITSGTVDVMTRAARWQESWNSIGAET